MASSRRWGATAGAAAVLAAVALLQVVGSRADAPRLTDHGPVVIVVDPPAGDGSVPTPSPTGGTSPAEPPSAPAATTVEPPVVTVPAPAPAPPVAPGDDGGGGDDGDGDGDGGADD